MRDIVCGWRGTEWPQKARIWETREHRFRDQTEHAGTGFYEGHSGETLSSNLRFTQDSGQNKFIQRAGQSDGKPRAGKWGECALIAEGMEIGIIFLKKQFYNIWKALIMA